MYMSAFTTALLLLHCAGDRRKKFQQVFQGSNCLQRGADVARVFGLVQKCLGTLFEPVRFLHDRVNVGSFQEFLGGCCRDQFCRVGTVSLQREQRHAERCGDLLACAVLHHRRVDLCSMLVTANRALSHWFPLSSRCHKNSDEMPRWTGLVHLTASGWHAPHYCRRWEGEPQAANLC